MVTPQDQLTVALVAPPWYPLPPQGYGGSELVVSLLATGLRDRGHRVLLYAADDSRDEVIGLGDAGWRDDLGKVHNQGLRDVTYAARVSAHLAAQPGNIDIVHDHSGLSMVVAALSLNVAPVIHTVHGGLFEPLVSALSTLGPSVALVGISENQVSPAPDLNWVGVVPNAVDVDRLRYLPAAARDAYLLVLARVCPDKGQHHAIEVARRSGMRLVLAGKVDPGHEEYFEQEIRPHLGVAVAWIENVAGPGKADLLARATAVLAPITWDEPFGLSMVEAMVSGTPTIAFRRGSVPEVIDDGMTGFIVDTVDEMVDAVARVHTIDPARCSLTALNRFSPDAMVDAYLTVYRRVASGLSSQWSSGDSAALDA